MSAKNKASSAPKSPSETIVKPAEAIPARRTRFLGALTRRGTAMVDMVILLGLISLVSIGAVGLAGGQVSHVFCEAAGTIDVSLGGKGFCLGKPAVSQAWIKSHTNPNFNPTFSFKDQLFAQGTSGTQTVMVPKTGDYTEAMTFSVAAPGPEAFAACVEQNKGDTPVCGTPSTSASSVTVAPSDYAVGYSVTLPGNTGQAVSDDIALTLATTTQDHLKKTWNINVGRTSTGQAFSTSMVFADHAFPAGAIGNQHFVMVPLPADFSGSLTFSTNGNSQLYMAPCYEATASDVPHCGNETPYTANETVPANTYAIGYQVTLPSNNTTVDWSQQVSLSLSEAGLTGSQSWTPTLSRPAGALIFDPQMTFSDLTVPGDTYGNQQILIPIQGNFTTGLTWASNGLSGTVAVAPCTGTTDTTGISCNGETTGQSTQSIPLSKLGNPTNYIGYQANLGTFANSQQAISQDVNLTLTSSADSTQTKTYTVHISRPTGQTELNATGTFADVALTPGTSDYSLFQDISTLTANTPLTLATNGNGSVYASPCIESGGSANNNKSTTCNTSGGTTGTDTMSLPTNAQNYGYSISQPSHLNAIDSYVDLTASSTVDPSVNHNWHIHVTRPSFTVTLSDATLADQILPGKATSGSGFATNYTDANSPYTLTTNGGGGLVEVAPCYQYQEYITGGYTTATQCGATTTGVSSALSVISNGVNGWSPGRTSIGYKVVIDGGNPYEAINQNITLTETSAWDPSKTETWTINVSRPKVAPTLDTASFNDVTVPAGTTSANINWDASLTKGDSNFYLTTDGGGTISVRPTQYSGYSYGYGSYSTGVSPSITVGWNMAAIGAQIDFSSVSRTIAIDQNVTLHAVSVYDPTVTADYTFHVTRPAPTAPAATFADVTLSPGEVDAPVELDTSYTPSTGTAYLSTNGQGTLSMRPAYQVGTNNAYGTYTTGASGNLTVPTNATSIGFQIDASSVPAGTAIDEYVTVTGTSIYDSTKTQTWTIHVTRPAMTAALMPASDMNVNPSFAASLATGWQTVLFPVTGSPTGPISVITNGEYSTYIRPCYQMTSGGPVNCSGANSGQTMKTNEIDSHGTPYAIGYQVYLFNQGSSSYQGNTVFTFEQAWTSDLSQNTTANGTITRN